MSESYDKVVNVLEEIASSEINKKHFSSNLTQVISNFIY